MENTQIKQYAERLIAGNRKRESYLLDGVGYEVVKIPPIDPNMLLMKITTKVTKSLTPILIPAIALFTSGAISGDMDVSKVLEKKEVVELLDNLHKLDEDDLAWLMEIASYFTCRIGEKKPVDMDWVIDNYPQHYFLILFNFLKINVGALFFGNNMPETKAGKQEMTIQ